MKKWLLIGGGLVVVILAGLFYLYSSLGSLIKTAVEKYGSEITQAKVRLNAAEVSATSGTGALRGLFVGNPQGFKTASAFQLGEISLTLDVGTITSDPVVIKEIVVSAPEVTYELGPQGSNIDTIKRNVDGYLKGSGTKKEAESTAESKKAAGRKIVIENLYIRNGRVNIGSTISDKTMSAPLPDIHLTNIGKQKGGATPGEVAEKIIGALGQSANTAIASVDTSKVLGDAKKQFAAAAGGLEEKGKGAVGGVKKLFTD
jgi:uncharacterized protein involved in outer membrane biogenesis